ncbi:MAG: restriction endonuclease [Eubacteriales bacterium]
MIYWCFNCSNISFDNICSNCSEEFYDDYIPLDPTYYPELNYKSKGFIIDLFKRKEKQYLELKKEEVIVKYNKYKQPYFINFMHLVGKYGTETGDPATDPKLNLFKQVLLRLDFNEIADFPELLSKLVRSTAFQFRYNKFVTRFEPHIKSSFKDTLRSYISESGTTYRENYYMMLYYFWTNNLFNHKLEFKSPEDDEPLMSYYNANIFLNICESIYNDILVIRLKNSLENFDKKELITMYEVDIMSGYEFEDFVVKIFNTLGYSVEETKRSNDQGADLFATRYGQKIVIQAKNYKDNVGNSAIQQVLTAKRFYGCDQAMVITNRLYTPSAKELAEASEVKLVDRNELQKMAIMM